MHVRNRAALPMLLAGTTEKREGGEGPGEEPGATGSSPGSAYASVNHPRILRKTLLSVQLSARKRVRSSQDRAGDDERTHSCAQRRGSPGPCGESRGFGDGRLVSPPGRLHNGDRLAYLRAGTRSSHV